MRPLRCIVVVTALAAMPSFSAWAQTVLAGWDVNGLVNSGPSPFAPTASSSSLVAAALKGPGVTNTTTANVWGANSWNTNSEANAITNGKYVTFSITPNPGTTISITNISRFYVTKSGTGPASGELQWSTNGTDFTDITPVAYGTQGTAITAANIGTFNLSGITAFQNLSNATATLRIVNWGATSTAGTWYLANGASGSDFELQGVVTGPAGGSPPHIVSISPTSITTNAGLVAGFTVVANGDPATNAWYKIVGSTTNRINGATSSTLTLSNVLAADTASYFAILTNASGADTSSIVSLTVVGDPHIAVQPANTYALLNGTVLFAVSAAGTAPAYQWYFTDTSGNLIAPVSDGHSTASGVAVVSGATSSTLSIANFQLSDLTNVVVVVSNGNGSVTSSVASVLGVNLTGSTLAFWDFNGTAFTNQPSNYFCGYNPSPYIGAGSAQAVGSCYNPNGAFSTSVANSPFSGSVDPNDGLGFTTHLPPFSWGTDNYPASGGNKQNGVQFNVSTVGAKDIKISYESRVSATASDYERLQYTTNGTDWADFPASSTFGGIGTTYLPFHYDLTGFPGVANNPSFAFRVVTEVQSTATYGVSPNTNYLGTANNYNVAGTVTYDLVTVSGDAITNNNQPPTISAIANTNSPDYLPLTVSFTVSDDSTPPDLLTYSAVSSNSATVNPTFTFGGSGANRTLTITPNTIPDQIDAAPILVYVTDANGDSTVTSFLLTLSSVNLAPTNTLTTVTATNILANRSITIPFSVGDDRTAASGLQISVDSTNNTVIPRSNIVINNAGTANPSVTITPAANQLGVASISVTVSDNDVQEPRCTTASIAVMVRPNTNVVALDYFNYDSPGPLDTVSSGFWQRLSGPFHQMKVAPGAATVDTLNNTENVQTPLLGAPYKTNSSAVLYASFIVNMDPAIIPQNNGSYFALFNDGSGVTGNYEARVVAATNGAAAGYYRLGIANLGADANSAVMLPQDLLPDSNYVVVMSLVLSNGFSTLWVNPLDQTSTNVTDTTPAGNITNLFNIADFELRESGAVAGSIRVSYLKVGTSFDAVMPSLHVQTMGANTVVTWSDPTLPIQSATDVAGPYVDAPGATPPYTNSIPAHPVQFFRFKR